MKEPKLALFIMRYYHEKDRKKELKAAAAWGTTSWAEDSRRAEEREKKFIHVASLVGIVCALALSVLVASIVLATNLSHFGMWGLVWAFGQTALFGLFVAMIIWVAIGGPITLYKAKNKKLRKWAEVEVEKWESQ